MCLGRAAMPGSQFTSTALTGLLSDNAIRISMDGRIRSPKDMAEYWTTADADPRAVYHDVLIALDEARGINNGQPSLWALLLDHLDILAGERVLHLDCGIGHYTAVVAELVGPMGWITARLVEHVTTGSIGA